ncbi:hypothetical protein AOC36_00315 [Erysipelothrix larvae]|uniref:Hydrolase n=1 Tax=Erysipelothrix larvae TaxID=1514105 RepID=A0A120JTD5_9FIRM|nr:Cof-type HAD-IIB family hydrolase [Erysipelothrix larvae]AMC92490.1 hypothetical protein AOC36_00315 [Erysipelothrix larvae]
MKVKMVASDIDGTIINEQGKAGIRTRNVVKKLKEHGIEFVIATGRSFEGAYDVCQQLDMQDEEMGIICVNGLETYDVPSLKVKRFEGMTFDECTMLEEITQSFYMGIMYCFSDAMYFQMDDLSYRDYMISIGDDNKHFFNRKLDMVFINSLEEIRDKFLIEPLQKIALLQNPDYMDLVVDRIRNKIPEGYNVLRVGHGWTEIMNASVDKAIALKEYAARFGIDTSEIMAFGDSENDLGMLNMVGYPVAMSNSMEAIKQIPNIEFTQSNNEQGVALRLEKLLESLGS